MKAEAVEIESLFNTANKAYVIPGYQRPFAWDKTRATDLLESIFEDFDSGASFTSIGTLLFAPISQANASVFGNGTAGSVALSNYSEVVDGQQRLTFYALTGIALARAYDALPTPKTFTPPVEFDALYSNSKTRSGQIVPSLIREEDNYDSNISSGIAILLQAAISKQIDAVLKKNHPKQMLIGDALVRVLQAIEDWVKANITPTNFDGFAKYFFKNCEVIQVVADTQDMAFTMFEPLNSTSEPLTALEVFRSNATRNIAGVSFANMESFLDYDNSERDEVINRSNNLVFSIAQVYSGKRPKKQFLPLKKYMDVNVNQAFINALESGADFYKSVWDVQSYNATWFDNETKNCIRFLNAVGHDAPVPLLARYFNSAPIDFPAVAKMVVAFYSLWRSVEPTNRLPSFYRDLFDIGSADNMALNGGVLKSKQDLAKYFRNLLNNVLVKTSSHTPEQSWKLGNVQKFLNYNDTKNICRLFIFVDMDRSLKINLVPNDPWTSPDDIEHIDAKSTSSLTKVNEIGNLTFLPGKVNRSIQAMGFTHKKELYAALAHPFAKQLTTFADGTIVPAAAADYQNSRGGLCLGHLLPISQMVSWDDAAVERRSKAMLSNVWDVLYSEWLNP